MQTTGTVYIIAAASGTGKTSLAKSLVKTVKNAIISISHTSRPMHPGEQNGVDYFFVTRDEFEILIAKNAFLEHAEVFGNYYGTSHQFIAEQLQSGNDIILDIDWQGARQVRRNIAKCISIFLLPPSKRILRQRLEGRNRDPSDVIAHRLQMASSEIQHYHEFDYLVINDNFSQALKDLETIVYAQRLARPYQEQRHAALLEELVK